MTGAELEGLIRLHDALMISVRSIGTGRWSWYWRLSLSSPAPPAGISFMNGRIFCYSLLALIFSLPIVNDITNNPQKTRAMMATRALGESLTEALQLNGMVAASP